MAMRGIESRSDIFLPAIRYARTLASCDHSKFIDDEARYKGRFGGKPRFDVSRPLMPEEQLYQLNYARGVKGLLESKVQEIEAEFDYEALLNASGMEGFLLGNEHHAPHYPRCCGAEADIDYSFLTDKQLGYKIGFAAHYAALIENSMRANQNARNVPMLSLKDYEIPVFDEEFHAFSLGERGEPFDLLARRGRELEMQHYPDKDVWNKKQQARAHTRDRWSYMGGLKVFQMRNGDYITDTTQISHPDRLYGYTACLNGKTAGEAIFTYMKSQAQSEEIESFITSQYATLKTASVSQAWNILDIDVPFYPQVRQVLAGYKLAPICWRPEYKNGK